MECQAQYWPIKSKYYNLLSRICEIINCRLNLMFSGLFMQWRIPASREGFPTDQIHRYILIWVRQIQNACLPDV